MVSPSVTKDLKRNIKNVTFEGSVRDSLVFKVRFDSGAERISDVRVVVEVTDDSKAGLLRPGRVSFVKRLVVAWLAVNWCGMKFEEVK